MRCIFKFLKCGTVIYRKRLSCFYDWNVFINPNLYIADVKLNKDKNCKVHSTALMMINKFRITFTRYQFEVINQNNLLFR